MDGVSKLVQLVKNITELVEIVVGMSVLMRYGRLLVFKDEFYADATSDELCTPLLNADIISVLVARLKNSNGSNDSQIAWVKMFAALAKQGELTYFLDVPH